MHFFWFIWYIRLKFQQPRQRKQLVTVIQTGKIFFFSIFQKVVNCLERVPGVYTKPFEDLFFVPL